MPLLLKTLSVAFPVFSIIGIGYLFASFKRISLGPIIEVLLYLTIPALVMSSLSQKRLLAVELLTVGFAAVFVVLGIGLVSYIFLTVVKRRDLKGFYLPTMFMNSGNMSFPLALLAFGSDGLTVAVLYYIPVSLLVYTVGIYIAKGDGGLSEIFKLPLIYAAAAGIALNLWEVTIPGPALVTFEMLGAATIPLMQLSLGYRLHSARLSYPGMSVAGSVIRIGGGFLLACLVTYILNIDGVLAKVIILSSTMPSAVINFIVSHKYSLDSDLVASTVALSTLMSVFTVPLVLLWIM